MNFELGMVLTLLMAAIVMFAMNRPRMDVVALIMLTLLPFTGVITIGEALSGFSNQTIVLVAALFVIGDGLVRTGVAHKLGDWLIVKSGSSETKLLTLLMLVVGGLGSTMSSTAVTAIFIPVGLRIAQRTGISPSQIMMPLSMAALISGMTTLVATTPNLIVNSVLQNAGSPGLHFFSFTPIGIPILILGIVYMQFARRWLKPSTPADKNIKRPTLSNWIELYNLTEREYRLRITKHSPLAGRTLEDLNLGEDSGMNLIAIERIERFSHEVLQPTPKRELYANDVLLLDLSSPEFDINELKHRYALEELPLRGAYFNDMSQEIGMAEVILPAESDLVGQSVIRAMFRTRTGLTVIGLRRGVQSLQSIDILNEELKIGDTLLVAGSWRDIQRLRQDDTNGVILIRTPVEEDQILPASGKAIPAIGSLLLVVGLMVSGKIPNVHAALIGCLCMGAFGCISINSAYRAIEWKTIMLIVGMLPFSLALQKTGGVELAAHFLKTVTSSAGPSVTLAALFVCTMVLGMFISNTATAVLMAPIAITLANDLGYSVYPFAMIVALAASTAFMTPLASPANTLVVTPGNYKFSDFVRVGLPFSIVVLIVCVLMVPRLMPL